MNVLSRGRGRPAKAVKGERETLLRLDRSIGRARFSAYAMLEVDETLAETLDAPLREAGELVRRRLLVLERRRG